MSLLRKQPARLEAALTVLFTSNIRNPTSEMSGYRRPATGYRSSTIFFVSTNSLVFIRTK